MPQLDKFTYFSQFFWLCLFFFTFYIFICNDGDGVLGISRILKLRNQLLSHRGKTILSKDPNSLEDLLRKGFSTGVSYMYASLFEVSQWCKAVDLLGKRRKITLFGGSRAVNEGTFALKMIVTAFIGYVLPWGQMSFWNMFDSSFKNRIELERIEKEFIEKQNLEINQRIEKDILERQKQEINQRIEKEILERLKQDILERQNLESIEMDLMERQAEAVDDGEAEAGDQSEDRKGDS